MVDIRLLHQLQELAGIGGKRLHITALALGIDRIEGERGFARAGQAGHHRQLVARNIDVDVLQIVLARAADGDVFQHSFDLGQTSTLRDRGHAPQAPVCPDGTWNITSHDSAVPVHRDKALLGGADRRPSLTSPQGTTEIGMAGSVNKVILIGNLGKDPESRRVTSGDLVVNLSVATSETWRDKASGERKEKTEWHRVVIWNENLAKVAEQYLRKGSKVYLEGALQTRKWTDKDGVEKYSTEVVLQRFRGELVMLDTKGEGGGGARVSGTSDAPASFERSEMDDEIPF